MRLRTLCALLLSAFSFVVSAQEGVWIHHSNGVALVVPIENTDSIDFDSEKELVRFYVNSTIGEVSMAEVDSLSFGEVPSTIRVCYSENGPKVVNPYAFRGVEVMVEAGRVTVNSVRSDELTYELTGEGQGSFKLYSAHKQVVCLNGLVLTSTDGPALNIQSKKKTTIELTDGTNNKLTDVATYTLTADEDAKGALFSEGQLVFVGEGALSVSGLMGHAICSDDYVRIAGGKVTVECAQGDGMNANDYFEMTGGSLQVSGVTGDCVDGGEGYAEISGGALQLTVASVDAKALKADSTMTIAGGELTLNLLGNCSKGLKSKQDILISGGALKVVASGGVVVESGETSYCSAIKADGNLNITGGTVDVQHSGVAGKGISVDGNLEMTGGTVTMKMTGNGGTYTNSSNTSDTYNATCIKVDGNLNLLAGNLELSASGSGGKCISVDGVSVYGSSNSGPSITAQTSGSKVSGSSSQGGGNRPGGNWHPGGTSSSSGGSPKVIRGEGAVTIENGTFVLASSAEGGEGVESKTVLTVNGGTIEARTYDDGLQAKQQLVINGGKIFVNASNNDGIDSNGTLTITGGTIVSCGTTQPEEGFDCDQNTFTITGGTLVGVGGATSNPTASVTTQCAVVYSASGSQNTTYTVCNSSTGEHVFSFVLPRAYSQMTMLFSNPKLQKSTGYTIYTGGNLSGGESFNGLTTGADFDSGTSKKTFTISSTVSTVR